MHVKYLKCGFDSSLRVVIYSVHDSTFQGPINTTRTVHFSKYVKNSENGKHGLSHQRNPKTSPSTDRT